MSGTAKALILATGRNAQLGSIAGALQKQSPRTAFAVGIQKFEMMIVQATIFLSCSSFSSMCCFIERCSNPSCSRWPLRSD